MRNHVPHLAGSGLAATAGRDRVDGGGHRADWQTGGVASEGPEARTGAQAVERAMAIIVLLRRRRRRPRPRRDRRPRRPAGQHRPPDRAGAGAWRVTGPGQPDRAVPPRRPRWPCWASTAIAQLRLGPRPARPREPGSRHGRGGQPRRPQRRRRGRRAAGRVGPAAALRPAARRPRAAPRLRHGQGAARLRPGRPQAQAVAELEPLASGSRPTRSPRSALGQPTSRPPARRATP